MKDIQQKNDGDLKTHLNEKRESLRELRFKASGSGMRDGHAIGNTKKEIARTLTELNKRSKEANDA